MVMPLDCAALTDLLVTHMRDEFTCIFGDDRVRIVTPFKRPGGDLIDVYVRPYADRTFVVSDLGESLGFLVSMGYDPRGGTNSGFALRHNNDGLIFT